MGVSLLVLGRYLCVHIELLEVLCFLVSVYPLGILVGYRCTGMYLVCSVYVWVLPLPFRLLGVCAYGYCWYFHTLLSFLPVCFVFSASLAFSLCLALLLFSM